MHRRASQASEGELLAVVACACVCFTGLHGKVLTKPQVVNVVRSAATSLGVKYSDKEVNAMVRIAFKESRYNTMMDLSKSPRKSSAGLFGFLDSTRDNYGGWGPCPWIQTRGAVRYVRDRYGSPTKGLRFHIQNGYY